jgi:AraC-like DNA-binding protein
MAPFARWGNDKKTSLGKSLGSTRGIQNFHPEEQSIVDDADSLALSTGVRHFGDQFLAGGIADLHAVKISLPEGGSGSFNHTEPSVVYLESGQVWLGLDGFRGWIEGGTLVALPAGLRTMHSGPHTRAISLGLGSDGLTGRFSVQPTVIRLARRDADMWHQRMLAMAENPHPDRSEVRSAVATALSGAVERRERTRQELMDDFMGIVECKVDRAMPLRELADRLGYSPHHLPKIVTLHSNRSIRQWVIGFRMEAARRLLKQPELSVSDVASKVGLEAQYFTRCFRQHFKLPPSEWRAAVFAGTNIVPMMQALKATGFVDISNRDSAI